ncbi:MAG TPA: outer membrane protein [Beijerinckiaceae bacterium]|jgi:opacity protein-like surface antigen
MGSLRTWIIAGALAVSGQAFAADLLPPAPVFDQGDAAPITELGSGWYIRGDIGYTDYIKPKEVRGWSDGRPFDKLDLESATSVGGGFGYKLTNWLRADVTADYRFGSDFEALSSGTNYVHGYSRDWARQQSHTLLANAYLDLGTYYGFTPYVGAGVGVAQTHFSPYNAQVVCKTPVCVDAYGLVPPVEVFPPKRRYNLAYAFMAGTAFNLGQGFLVDLGYRYLNVGETETLRNAYTSGSSVAYIGTKIQPLRAHEVRLGVRYMID